MRLAPGRDGKALPGATAIVVLLGLLLIVGAACTSAQAEDDIPPTPVFDPTPAPAPLPTSTPRAATPTPVAAGTAEPASAGPEDAIAAGKLIFEKTAGGVGCALCHGLDGKGKVESGAPGNRGASADTIWAALQDRPQMTFITLTDREIEDVAAYLGWLATQP